uniref:F-box domain-containing protein n=1 Tax=Acrobeloides nanus TaxID=290746 RepID=A0A914DRM8_9BILA
MKYENIKQELVMAKHNLKLTEAAYHNAKEILNQAEKKYAELSNVNSITNGNIPAEILINVMQFIPRMKLEKIQMVNKQFNNQIKGANEILPLRLIHQCWTGDMA